MGGAWERRRHRLAWHRAILCTFHAAFMNDGELPPFTRRLCNCMVNFHPAGCNFAVQDGAAAVLPSQLRLKPCTGMY